MGFKQIILDALWEGAQARVQCERPIVIAVTGSVGKTTVKELIVDLLETTGKPVVKTHGGLNTEFGVPLSLLGYKESPSSLLGWLGAVLTSFTPPKTPGLKKGERPYYVLEYAQDKSGDISFLCNKIHPDIAILTVITPVHMESYQSFDQLRAEKLSLIAGLLPGGVAIVNADDPEQALLPQLEKGSYTTLSYGAMDSAAKRAGVWVSAVSLKEKGLHCTIHYQPGKSMDGIGKQQPQTLELQTQVLTEAQLHGMLAASVVALREGVHPDQLKQILEQFSLPAGRGRRIDGARDVLIIDESYNSSPSAVISALHSLGRLGKASKRRRVAVLGRMNELGEHAEQYHREVATAAAHAADSLVFVGQYGEVMKESALAAGISSSLITIFSSTEALIDQAEQVIQKNDLVLVKGSQNGVRLESFVKRIMLHPERAASLLVRQSGRWK